MNTDIIVDLILFVRFECSFFDVRMLNLLFNFFGIQTIFQHMIYLWYTGYHRIEFNCYVDRWFLLIHTRLIIVLLYVN